MQTISTEPFGIKDCALIGVATGYSDQNLESSRNVFQAFRQTVYTTTSGEDSSSLVLMSLNTTMILPPGYIEDYIKRPLQKN